MLKPRALKFENLGIEKGEICQIWSSGFGV
jgi:hypothetical protein